VPFGFTTKLLYAFFAPTRAVCYVSPNVARQRLNSFPQQQILLPLLRGFYSASELNRLSEQQQYARNNKPVGRDVFSAVRVVSYTSYVVTRKWAVS
jgi:hypothetical protein